MEKVIDVVIVGAGPAGLATSACLNRLNISNLVLEREDCYASLWRNRAYDRLKLHLAKQFYELPFMPFPKNTPKYAPKKDFIHYLDTYVATFNVSPKFHRSVKSASYDEEVGEWCLLVNNTKLGIQENYYAKILVVASGENSEGYIPQIDGLESFKGEIVHLSEYGNGDKYSRKDVLVVGAGNSEMEIAYDLSNFGANTSIVVRGPVHVVTEEIVYYGMSALKYFSVKFVDVFVMLLAKLKFGNLSKYGIYTPTMRPFHIKQIKRSIPHHRCWDYPKKGEIRVCHP